MKVKLVQNFHKAYSFIFAVLTAVTAFALDFFEVVPPETFGEHGLKAAGVVAVLVAVLRVLPQPKDGLE